MIDLLPGARPTRRARRTARLIMSRVARACDAARARGHAGALVAYPTDDDQRRVMRAAIATAAAAGGYRLPEAYPDSPSDYAEGEIALGQPLIVIADNPAALKDFEQVAAQRGRDMGIHARPWLVWVPPRCSGGTALALGRALLRRIAENRDAHAVTLTALELPVLGGYYTTQGTPSRGVWGALYNAIYRLQRERG